MYFCEKYFNIYQTRPFLPYNMWNKSVRFLVLFFVTCCACLPTLTAQNDTLALPTDTATRAGFWDGGTGLPAVQKKRRQWWVGSANVAAYGGSLVLLNEAWYKNEPRSKFHTYDDSREWLQMDKAGHAWTAYTTGRLSSEIWQWAGMEHKKAVWLGGLSGTAYLTVIEFLDAYSAKWGFSWSDMAANLSGSLLYIGQELGWKEQRIQLKFSFHANKYSDPMLDNRADELFGKGLYERTLKDYNAQTYWLSANVHSFFKESNFPKWLNIAVGYGADGMWGGYDNKWEDKDGNIITRYDIPRKRQFFLSPDIDLTKIKTKSKFLRTCFFMLNAIKIPAPALMLDSKGKMKFYPLYF